jgi:hypothetical protein
MPKCKNPECQEQILDTLNYCNEACLRKHMELKQEASYEKCLKSAIHFLTEMCVNPPLTYIVPRIRSEV